MRHFRPLSRRSLTRVMPLGLTVLGLLSWHGPAQAAGADAGLPGAGAKASSATLEEGKALFENGQYMAALSKFMSVLRNDPRQPDARRYLERVVEAMKQNPTQTMGRKSMAAVAPSPQQQEELRAMMRKRSLFTLDLKAIPGVKLTTDGAIARVEIDTPILFGDKGTGLKEEGIPILDRVAAWLKTYGEQPVLIHCYPEELQDPSTSGPLFLTRYSELYNFMVEERKISAKRLISTDSLAPESGGTKTPELDTVGLSKAPPHIVFETVGSQTSYLEAMPAATPKHAIAQWLEFAVILNKALFNPDEGEWVSIDAAALSRTGVRNYSLTIAPVNAPSRPVYSLQGQGNLLKRILWEGKDQKSGSFVPAGSYAVKLAATDTDGLSNSAERTVDVQAVSSQVLASRPYSPDEESEKKAAAKKTAKKSAKKAAKKAAPKAASVASGDPESLPKAEAEAPVAPATAPADTTSAAAADDDQGGVWKRVLEFDLGDTQVRPTLKASLDQISKTLEVYPLQKVRIVGFASMSENDPNGMAKKRAEAVRTVLVNEFKVDKKRIIMGGIKVNATTPSKVEMSIRD